MPDKHYLEHYDDSESASCVPQAKQEGITPREYAETGYIPMFVYRDALAFTVCLTLQPENFIYDIFCRVYDLFGEFCPYSREEFSVENYSGGDALVRISVIELPKKDLQEGNIPKMVFVLDMRHKKEYFLLVRQEMAETNIYYFDLYTGDWKAKGAAPAGTDALLARVLQILNHQYCHYISVRCPICKRTYQLGLTDEERDGYQRYCNDDEDLEDAIPTLNAFEREFLASGMCPHCQCDVFHKELPADLSRWEEE